MKTTDILEMSQEIMGRVIDGWTDLSPSEKLARQELNKLAKNSEELRKLKQELTNTLKD